jgi:hypothetical protein
LVPAVTPVAALAATWVVAPDSTEEAAVVASMAVVAAADSTAVAVVTGKVASQT